MHHSALPLHFRSGPHVPNQEQHPGQPQHRDPPTAVAAAATKSPPPRHRRKRVQSTNTVEAPDRELVESDDVDAWMMLRRTWAYITRRKRSTAYDELRSCPTGEEAGGGEHGGQSTSHARRGVRGVAKSSKIGWGGKRLGGEMWLEGKKDDEFEEGGRCLRCFEWCFSVVTKYAKVISAISSVMVLFGLVLCVMDVIDGEVYSQHAWKIIEKTGVNSWDYFNKTGMEYGVPINPWGAIVHTYFNQTFEDDELYFSMLPDNGHGRREPLAISKTKHRAPGAPSSHLLPLPHSKMQQQAKEAAANQQGVKKRSHSPENNNEQEDGMTKKTEKEEEIAIELREEAEKEEESALEEEEAEIEAWELRHKNREAMDEHDPHAVAGIHDEGQCECAAEKTLVTSCSVYEYM
eukprot:GHVQ01033122.1.p1 GENE.GHVQ01033122.1~~GHVQ01033122.1.p1  ORF type:complete len:434 (+),score=89.79 GHVQ01033122.1:90-1304(+)